MAFVVDNSVVVAWLRDGQATSYTRAAFKRLDREAAHVPALCAYEFVNAVRSLERRGMKAHRVNEAIARYLDLGLRVDRDPVNPADLLEVARRAGLAAYDAAYVELAARLGLPLATKDEDMRAGARKLGIELV